MVEVEGVQTRQGDVGVADDLQVAGDICPGQTQLRRGPGQVGNRAGADDLQHDLSIGRSPGRTVIPSKAHASLRLDDGLKHVGQCHLCHPSSTQGLHAASRNRSSCLTVAGPTHPAGRAAQNQLRGP